MLDEILKSARQQIVDRLSSPLLGSFAIAWCLWNYKFFVILFSAASVTRTFELIETFVFPDPSSVLIRGILLPAATALAYIFFYPYPARFVFGFTQRRQREVNELRQQIEDETLLTAEESRRIRNQVIAAEVAHRKVVDQLNEEVSKLRDALTAATSSPEKRSTKETRLTAATKPSLTHGQVELIEFLFRKGGKGVDLDHVRANLKQSEVELDFNLGELESQNLIERAIDDREDTYISFTHEGRRIAMSLQQSPSEIQPSYMDSPSTARA